MGRKAKQAEITKITQGSTTLVGVLRPRSCGLLDGCTEVYDIKKAPACKVSQMATSTEAMFDGEVDNAWQKAQRDQSFGVSSVDMEGTNMLQLQSSGKSGKRKAADEFDDLMDFETVTVTGGLLRHFVQFFWHE